MIAGCRYVHTNLIASDYKALSRFYCEVFGCVPVPPERHFKGTDLEAGTGISGAELSGVHLRLPGFGDNGPTLEIFSYNILKDKQPVAVNRPGFGHIAFSVSDVKKGLDDVLAAGGGSVGEIVTLEVQTGARVTWCYVMDPEGNVMGLWEESK